MAMDVRIMAVDMPLRCEKCGGQYAREMKAAESSYVVLCTPCTRAFDRVLAIHPDWQTYLDHKAVGNQLDAQARAGQAPSLERWVNYERGLNEGHRRLSEVIDEWLRAKPQSSTPAPSE
jgi:hypothetical protein